MLLERPPPVGAMPLVGVNSLRLAARALVSSHGFGGSEAGEVEGADARVASNEEGRKTVLERLPEIQVWERVRSWFWCPGGISSRAGIVTDLTFCGEEGAEKLGMTAFVPTLRNPPFSLPLFLRSLRNVVASFSLVRRT